MCIIVICEKKSPKAMMKENRYWMDNTINDFFYVISIFYALLYIFSDIYTYISFILWTIKLQMVKNYSLMDYEPDAQVIWLERSFFIFESVILLFKWLTSRLDYNCKRG